MKQLTPKGIWEGHQRTRPARYKKEMRKLRKILHKLLPDIAQTTSAREETLFSGIMILIYKAQYGLSYRDLATESSLSKRMRTMCNLDSESGKSKLFYRARAVASIKKEFLDEILRQFASDANCNDIHGDSTGISTSKYEDWNHAKYGKISKQGFVKLHTLTAMGSKILAFNVTDAHAHDSPVFRQMMKNIPSGTGIITLDSAYDAYINCKMIVDTGRRPVIKPKSNSKVKGYSPRAKMVRWYQKDPASFLLAYGKRNLVESEFSSIKERTGVMVYAKSLVTQTAELFARVLYRNLIV